MKNKNDNLPLKFHFTSIFFVLFLILLCFDYIKLNTISHKLKHTNRNNFSNLKEENLFENNGNSSDKQYNTPSGNSVDCSKQIENSKTTNKDDLLVNANIKSMKSNIQDKFKDYDKYMSTLSGDSDKSALKERYSSESSLYHADTENLLKNSIDLPILDDYTSGDIVNNDKFSKENTNRLKHVNLKHIFLPKEFIDREISRVKLNDEKLGIVRDELKIEDGKNEIDSNSEFKELNPIILPIFQIDFKKNIN